MKEAPPLVGINSLFGEGHYFDYINNHISEALGDVSVPIAIFNAGDALPKHNFDTLNQELLVTKGMPNTSHFLMMEQSTEFNELLESILEEFKLIFKVVRHRESVAKAFFNNSTARMNFNRIRALIIHWSEARVLPTPKFPSYHSSSDEIA